MQWAKLTGFCAHEMLCFVPDRTSASCLPQLLCIQGSPQAKVLRLQLPDLEVLAYDCDGRLCEHVEVTPPVKTNHAGASQGA